jgi:death-on-curing protein
VEIIHDGIVAELWAFDEPVQAREYRDQALLDSAVNRPFQTALGKDIHRSVLDKAAALFHSLITNHPFANGNKRSAVIAVDMFLLANGYWLVLEPGEMYKLAKETAQHN